MGVRAKQVLRQPVAEEMILYDEDLHRAHRLDREAATMFVLADGARDLDEVSVEASARLGMPVQDDRARDVLEGLGAAGLLTEDAGSRLVLKANSAQSRRQVLEGTLTVAVPGILTVLAPTVTQAASPLACGIVRPCDG